MRGRVNRWIREANRCFETKAYEEAISTYRKLLAYDPRDPEVHFAIGNVLYQQQRYEQAVEHYGQAIRIRGDYSEAYTAKANALIKLDRPAEAFDCLKCAIRTSPQRNGPHMGETYNNLGVLESQRGHAREAIAMYTRAIECSASSPQYWYNRGSARYGIGEREGALSDWREAARLGSEAAIGQIASLGTHGGGDPPELRKFSGSGIGQVFLSWTTRHPRERAAMAGIVAAMRRQGIDHYDFTEVQVDRDPSVGRSQIEEHLKTYIAGCDLSVEIVSSDIIDGEAHPWVQYERELLRKQGIRRLFIVIDQEYMKLQGAQEGPITRVDFSDGAPAVAESMKNWKDRVILQSDTYFRSMGYQTLCGTLAELVERCLAGQVDLPQVGNSLNSLRLAIASANPDDGDRENTVLEGIDALYRQKRLKPCIDYGLGQIDAFNGSRVVTRSTEWMLDAPIYDYAAASFWYALGNAFDGICERDGDTKAARQACIAYNRALWWSCSRELTALILSNRGNLLGSTGDYRGALRDIATAHRLFPEHGTIRRSVMENNLPVATVPESALGRALYVLPGAPRQAPQSQTAFDVGSDFSWSQEPAKELPEARFVTVEGITFPQWPRSAQ
jgi:tetratricopeptide (TPR) repeat protein